jgi:hypothetical protein
MLSSGINPPSSIASLDQQLLDPVIFSAAKKRRCPRQGAGMMRILETIKSAETP